MKKIIYLFNQMWNPPQEEIDAYLVAVKNLSMRSAFEYNFDEIKKLKKEINKPLYLLCDALIGQDEILEVKAKIQEIFELGDKILFQDLSFFQFAKERQMLDKLVYYSPTLLVSDKEILKWKDLGISNFIISKEASEKDYLSILNNCKDVHLGMLGMGYPQIYFSKRKMISSYQDEYYLQINISDYYKIKEKSRDFYQPIKEDNRGTYIFAGEIFFPYQYFESFISLGMEYFLFDPVFMVDIKNNFKVFKESLNGVVEKEPCIKEKTSTFMMLREMVNDYEKKN